MCHIYVLLSSFFFNLLLLLVQDKYVLYNVAIVSKRSVCNMLNAVKKLLGDFQKRKLKKYEQLVQEINNLEKQMSSLPDEEFQI